MSSRSRTVNFNSFYLRSEPPSASILLSSIFNVTPYSLYSRDLFIVSRSHSLDLSNPEFHQLLDANPSSVLIKITHISTNFRDRGDLEQRIRSPNISDYFIGSDFVAVVVATGNLVDNLSISDRVIPCHTYPHQGLASVMASSGLLLLDAERLVSISNDLCDLSAATFSVPYQTALSLIRRSGVLNGCTHALVTAPSSATSLAIMQLLKLSAIPFTILARNESYVSKLHSLGFDRIVIADPSSSDFQTTLTSKLSALSITHVFDNFPDVYAFHLTPLLAYSCKYMFAGLLDQGVYFQDHANSSLLFSQILHRFMMKNIHFIGNCLGSRQDLISALELHTTSGLDISIDSEYGFSQIPDFINSSFVLPRFGKAVLQLNPS